MKILLDGKVVYCSEPVRKANTKSVHNVSIPISSAQELTLIVESSDGDKGGDHANWAEAVFLK